MTRCGEPNAAAGRCVLIEADGYSGCGASCVLARLRSVLSPMGPAAGMIGYAERDSIEDPETGEKWVTIRLA